MPNIRRRAGYRIITRAVELDGEPITGLSPAGADDYPPCDDDGELLARLAQQPGAFVVYNQRPAARLLVDGLGFSADKDFIEIRQDTRGALGLHALRRGAGADKTLPLVYQ